MKIPADAYRVSPGSSWGTFTIACTIPIALFVGLYMYKIRPGRVVEASLIGAVLDDWSDDRGRVHSWDGVGAGV